MEPFFSTQGVGKGTGLGPLPVSKKPGPTSNYGPVSSERLELPTTRPVEPAAASNSGTALLVDDEEMIRVSTADMMTEMGFTVIEASSAKEALAVLRRGDPIDILVADHLMPGMTGVDWAQTAMTNGPRCRFSSCRNFEVEGLPAHLPRLPKPFRQADRAKKNSMH